MDPMGYKNRPQGYRIRPPNLATCVNRVRVRISISLLATSVPLNYPGALLLGAMRRDTSVK